MKITDKLNELISSIDFQLKDCFYIVINESQADELAGEWKKIINEKIINEKELNFPIVYRGVIVAISIYTNGELKVKRDFESVNKVYQYELNNVTHYLNELEELCKKYNISIGGCGCCGSPQLIKFYTLSVDEVNYYDNKLHYCLDIKPYVEDIFRNELKGE